MGGVPDEEAPAGGGLLARAISRRLNNAAGTLSGLLAEQQQQVRSEKQTTSGQQVRAGH